MQQPRQGYRHSFIPLWLCLLLLSSLLPTNGIVNAAPAKQAALGTGVEFTYPGPGYTLTYRFIPNNGTLGDLSVIYNNSFVFNPSISGGVYWVTLAGEDLPAWDSRLQRQFLSESSQNGIYTATFRWSYNSDSLEFSVRLWREQNKLYVEYASASEKVTQFNLDRSELTPDPKVVELPYGHNVLYTNGIFVSGMIDHEASNASILYPHRTRFSNSSAYFAYGGEYRPLTNGRRRPLREKVILAVAPTIEDVFYYPNHPVSPYRQQLTNKVVVDLWQGDFAQQRQTLQTLADRGLTDLFVLLHRWQRFGYDNALPTTYPAGNDFGGPAALTQVSNLCADKNYLLALHTNYTEEYPNSPDWKTSDLALDADGNWIEGWRNPWTEQQSYVMKSARALHYANVYEPQIHSAYNTTAAFLDVHTATLPGNRTDQDATITDPGRQAVVLRDYRTLVANTRAMHGGPVAGEGFGYVTWLWSGHVDAIEADPRSYHDDKDGSLVPTLVDYKLRALHHLFVPHGVGYLERFYFDQWKDFTPAQLERYRATELAFGNAGFMSDLFGRNFSSERAIEEAVREYCVMKSLQSRYLASTPSTIRYYRANGWQTLSDVLRAVLPTVAFDNVDAALSEQLGIVQVVYVNGLTLYVNRTTNHNHTMTVNGTPYTLPPNGFLAHQGSDFLAYNALVNGVQRHYICPSEGICSTCPTPAVIKNGDFELGANGDWRLGTRRSQPIITSNAGVTPRSGSYVAQLGVANSETSTLAQTVQLPSQGPVTLSYHYQIRSAETRCTRERAEVRVNNKRVAIHNLCSSQNSSQWAPVTLDLRRYAGRSVDVQFYLKTNSTLPSTFLIDDVAVVNATGTQASLDEAISATEEEAVFERLLYLPLVAR